MPESQRPTPYSRFVAKQTPLTADMLNQAIDHANANRVMVGGPGIRVVRTPHGAVVSSTATRSVASPAQIAQRLQVTGVSGDYLTCRAWYGTTIGEADILVAKPRELRYSIYNSKSLPNHAGTLYDYTFTGSDSTGQTRTSTLHSDSDDTETQVVTPRYIARQTIASTIYDGSESWAITVVTGAVGSSGGDISLLDMNTAARAWAEDVS